VGLWVYQRLHRNFHLRIFGSELSLPIYGKKSAKAFLFGNDPEAFEAEIIVADILQQEKEALAS
jgi:hypothetical protein